MKSKSLKLCQMGSCRLMFCSSQAFFTAVFYHLPFVIFYCCCSFSTHFTYLPCSTNKRRASINPTLLILRNHSHFLFSFFSVFSTTLLFLFSLTHLRLLLCDKNNNSLFSLIITLLFFNCKKKNPLQFNPCRRLQPIYNALQLHLHIYIFY